MESERDTYPSPIHLVTSQDRNTVPGITVSIVGVKFRNEDGVPRQDLLGVLYDDYYTEGLGKRIKLELRWEQDNEYDPNAVGVWCTSPKKARGRLGFLPRDHAKVISTRLNMVAGVRVHSMGCTSRVFGSIRITVKRLVKDSEGREYEFA